MSGTFITPTIPGYTVQTDIVYRFTRLTNTGDFDLSINEPIVDSLLKEIDGTNLILNNGFDGTVNSILEDSNGKIYLGGSFTSYNGTAASRIIRLNADGTKDTNFESGIGFNNTVNPIFIDSNGKIYVGGSFTFYYDKNLGNTAANRIIRLNTDGTIDTNFVYGSGFGSSVNSIFIDSNGKIYVGGFFTSYNGTAANRIIRLNADGTVDTNFVYGSGFSSSPNSILEDSNGKIYLGGGFTSYNGTAANRIIRLNPDGTIDTNFVYGSGFGSSVISIFIDSNGKIYVGGAFTSYNGTAANRIIRLNADGTVDTNFVYGSGFDGSVNSIFIDSNGKIYVVGAFTSYNGTAANRIIRLNADGTVDTNFVYGSGFNSNVNSILGDSNGKIYLGGVFISYK